MQWTPDSRMRMRGMREHIFLGDRTRIGATAVSPATTRTMTRHACIKRRQRLNPMGDEIWSLETRMRPVQCGLV